MSLPPPSDHFQGKTVAEHLKEARTKGVLASTEAHGLEMAGHFSAAADTARDTTFVLLAGYTALSSLLTKQHLLLVLIILSTGWLIWKTSRSALMGWSRMERLHRITEQERWEIAHNRPQEREELAALYRTKGLEGKLLEEVVDVLMADDNRLLHIMLEEEMGLSLEKEEHPLKQACGALLGGALAAAVCLIGYLSSPTYGLFISAALILTLATTAAAQLEHNRILPSLVWTLATAGLLAGIVHYLTQLLF